MQGPEEWAESNAGLEATKKRGEGTMDRLKVAGQGEPLGLRRKNLNEQHLHNRQFRETAREETLRPGRAAAEPTHDLEEGGQKVSG